MKETQKVSVEFCPGRAVVESARWVRHMTAIDGPRPIGSLPAREEDGVALELVVKWMEGRGKILAPSGGRSSRDNVKIGYGFGVLGKPKLIVNSPAKRSGSVGEVGYGFIGLLAGSCRPVRNGDGMFGSLSGSCRPVRSDYGLLVPLSGVLPVSECGYG
ncbi:hypothetical protein NPIL_463361 [Nephila pilipes]|uniref:Uncharacterized protein n=1 Tax=Nephila pilipes TaxID=299642 RepID=A0A8X6U6N2_NEPPI|nr:hypothetical protein NPIL_463361 [Nephila pilipes]